MAINGEITGTGQLVALSLKNYCTKKIKYWEQVLCLEELESAGGFLRRTKKCLA